ncbi:hypothetical protein [Polynucleobacter sp. AP-Titi-500A-B4]|uniref:hypothetical protein n=1 Tax=Polynucleobacter sp. AP-Titi-500A-B4 TaxID=2576923 RepID=UPI001BFCDA12|nr:hypothetical protein [Polynucleobacter sp. AP-Titi-500A-B4]QWE12825.1 hypothetical protein FD968_01740 [Polynucleobacter sp. AP-Titi-500A-B4]
MKFNTTRLLVSTFSSIITAIAIFGAIKIAGDRLHAAEFGAYLLLRRLFSFSEPIATLGVFHRAVSAYAGKGDGGDITRALILLLMPACLVISLGMLVVMIILRYMGVIEIGNSELLVYCLLLLPYSIYLIYYSYVRGSLSSIQSDLIQIIAIGLIPLLLYLFSNSSQFIYYNIFSYLGCLFFLSDKKFLKILFISLSGLKIKKNIPYKDYFLSGIAHRITNIIQHNLIFLTIPLFTAITYGSKAVISFSIFIYILKISESMVEGLTRSAGIILSGSLNKERLSGYIVFLALIFINIGVFFGESISTILCENIPLIRESPGAIKLAIYFMPVYLGYILLRPICEIYESKEKSSIVYIVIMVISHAILFFPLNLSEKYIQIVPFLVFITAYTAFFIANITYLNLGVVKPLIRIYFEGKNVIIINFTLIAFVTIFEVEIFYKSFFGIFILFMNFYLLLKNEKNFLRYTSVQ